MSKLKYLVIGIVVLGIVAVSVITIAGAVTKRNVEKEVEMLLSKGEIHGEIIRKEEIEGLPQGVQRWLQYSGIIGQERISTLRSKQRGMMRLGEDQNWMPVEAEQYFTTEEPGFIWRAEVKAAPLVTIAARDKYLEGKGNMLIKPLSLFKAADATGKEIDQGTMLRYLAEIVWFPSAALENYIFWEEIDPNRARATMTNGDVEASGVFTFNEAGEMMEFEAERYGEFDGEFRLETWSITAKEYKRFNGIGIPTKGSVTWRLQEGDFTWYHFEVLDIEFNIGTPY